MLLNLRNKIAKHRHATPTDSRLRDDNTLSVPAFKSGRPQQEVFEKAEGESFP